MIIASLLSKKRVITYLEKVEHFSEVFKATDVEKHLQEEGIEIR
jgi:hypothetical protein